MVWIVREEGMTAVHVGFVIFPNITQLDFTGPYEVRAGWARRLQSQPRQSFPKYKLTS